jgi:hypothetical protein
MLLLHCQSISNFQFPIFISFFLRTCTAEGHIGFVQFDLFETRSDAMGSGTAGTTDGETGSLDLEVGGKDGRTCRSHGTGDTEGSDLVLPSLCLSLDSIAGFDNVGNRCSTLSDDGGNSVVLFVLFGFQSGILDSPIQGDVGESRVLSHKSKGGLRNQFFEIRLGEVWNSCDVGFDAEFGEFLLECNSRLGLVKARFHIF